MTPGRGVNPHGDVQGASRRAADPRFLMQRAATLPAAWNPTRNIANWPPSPPLWELNTTLSAAATTPTTPAASTAAASAVSKENAKPEKAPKAEKPEKAKQKEATKPAKKSAAALSSVADADVIARAAELLTAPASPADYMKAHKLEQGLNDALNVLARAPPAEPWRALVAALPIDVAVPAPPTLPSKEAAAALGPELTRLRESYCIIKGC